MNLPKIDKNLKLAVVGVSRDQNKFGFKVYQQLVTSGFTVYPINPKYSKIGGQPCYPTVTSLPEPIDILITVVPPAVTEKIVRQAHQAGIKTIWMQPGSESDTAINYCQNHGIEVIHHACIIVDGLNQQFT